MHIHMCIEFCCAHFRLFSYAQSLVDYMSAYLEKIQPLLDQSAVLFEVKNEFEAQWSQNQFPGWKVWRLMRGCGYTSILQLK